MIRFNPRMKVKDIVSEPLEIHNIGDGLEREKIVLDALREVKLEPPVENCKQISPHAFRWPKAASGFSKSISIKT